MPGDSRSDSARQALLSLWERRDEFGSPVGCIATTFTFDAPFFEEECLGRFIGMDTDPNEAAELYLVEREERLAHVFACVLVDRSHVPRARNLRWNLLPITVPGGGILHAKVTILVWENLIRVLVGSANLTSHGYRRNFEHMGVLEFSPAGGLPLDSLRSVLSFLEHLSTYAPRRGTDSEEGPQQALASFLQRIGDQIGDWPRNAWGRASNTVEFVTVEPGQPSLIEQVRSRMWLGAGPSDVHVLSPFFDVGDRARKLVDHLVEHMGRNGERTIHYYTSGRRLPDETVEYDLPGALANPWDSRRRHVFNLVSEIKEEEARALHAKSLWFQRQSRAVFVVGSSNFTCAGTGLIPGPVNIEANLAYILPSTTDGFARRCNKAYPPYERLSPAVEDVRFKPNILKETPEPESYAPLPTAFGEALFRPEGPGGVLILSIVEVPPQGFSVYTDSGTLFDAEAWIEIGQPDVVELPWTEKRPPSFVLVDWRDADDDHRTSIWVVNVTDASKLPPPEELRDLPLQVLVEILTSALPLYEAWRRAIRKHKARGQRGHQFETDPHRKVDTRNFLLRRVRRVAAALEGLRVRLERPAHHMKALCWRLHGPIGPVTLARQLAAQEGEGAAFMIAEVALTVHGVDWSASERLLGAGAVKREVDSVLRELSALAEKQSAPANLREYVKETLAVVNS